MTTPTLSTQSDAPQAGYAVAVGPEQIDRTARALAARGFTVEVVDNAQAARARVAALLPAGATVFTAASETLRLSGIEADLNGTWFKDALVVAGDGPAARNLLEGLPRRVLAIVDSPAGRS